MKSTRLLFAIMIIIMTLGCKKDGSDGKNSLTKLEVESAGENCSSGGYRISTGIDNNENNILDLEEIEYEEYVCNGNSGVNGSNSMINVVTETSGEFCDFGGLKIESGLDQNNNSVLEGNEIQAINYVCNGENGQSSGEISTIRVPFNLAYAWRYPSGTWNSEIQDGLLYGFNIDDYADFDSIIFVSQFNRGDETTDTLWLRLYDYTGNQGISNSELFSVIPDSQLNDPDKRIFRSGNFYNSIFSGPRTIGIQFKKETSGVRSISIHHAEIILHKSE